MPGQPPLLEISHLSKTFGRMVAVTRVELSIRAGERFALLGLGASLRLLVVVHCYRADDHSIRIVSARRATAVEARSYHQG